jgi:small subunit ribosomal protein S19e
MATFHDAPTDELIEAVAERLESDLEEPDWLTVAKTGAGRELPPEQEDFWARRGASLLRHVAIDGPVGVERLSTVYGDAAEGSNRYRVAPRHRTDGSKNVVRTLLQQLEDADLVDVASGDGRVITSAGQQLLDETAEAVLEDLDRPELERYV